MIVFDTVWSSFLANVPLMDSFIEKKAQFAVWSRALTKTFLPFTFLLLLLLIPIPPARGSASVRIGGQVRSEDDQPIVDAWIGLFDGQWNYAGLSTRTNQQGRYEISAPALSSYIIDIYPPAQLKNGIYGFNYYGLARKVWREDASSIIVDLVLQPVGNVVLKAFDENGNLMRQRDFGWARNVYATDSNGVRVDDRFTMLHDVESLEWDRNGGNGSLRLPAVAIALNRPRSMNLLWTVPGFGKIMVLADNDGKGYVLDHMGDVLIINLNYELARTQLNIVNRTLDSYRSLGYTISESVLTEISKVRQSFADASAALGDSEKALLSNKCLNQSLWAGEELEYENSLQRIELHRKKDVTLKILDEEGKPISGTKVTYDQTSHDFLFGTWEFGKWRPPLQAVGLMKDAGINYAVIGFFWSSTEPTSNHIKYISVPSDVKVQGHNVVWFHDQWGVGDATYLYSLDFPQLREEVYDHVYQVVKSSKGRVQYWTLVNELEGSWTNHWHLELEQLVDIVDVSCRAARNADPSATIILNFAVPAGEAAGYRYGVLGEARGYVPFELLQRIVERKIDFDAIGLQLYYGNVRQIDGAGHPARDALAISRILDWYAQFNKPIFITEVSVPSSYLKGREDFQYGYWHALPSEQTQSDWLRIFFTIAYSKPYVKCITWWDGSDVDSFAHYGGVLDENGRPKLAYYTLKDLIRSWTTQGVSTTDSDGVAYLRGYAGVYRIQVKGYDAAEVHVSEHDTNEITVTLKRQIVPGIEKTSITYGVVFIAAIVVVAALFAWKRSKSRPSRPQTRQLNVIDCGVWQAEIQGTDRSHEHRRILSLC